MAPAEVDTYATDDRSKGNRLAKRTNYDTGLVRDIIINTPIFHVSFNAPSKDAPGFPTILPMLGALAQYGNDDEMHIYLHGSSVARLMKLTAGNEIPLCVCATLLDGYVLTLAPFHNSCNYRSAVCFGYGTIVEDPDEILYALKEITNHAVPSRWENSRSEPTRAELTSTGVLKMRIETASAKVRTGGGSEERADFKNEELYSKTWCGVVPSYQVLGEPVPAEYNRVRLVPDYLEDWVADVNSINEQRAIDSVDEGAKE